MSTRTSQRREAQTCITYSAATMASLQNNQTLNRWPQSNTALNTVNSSRKSKRNRSHSFSSAIKTSLSSSPESSATMPTHISKEAPTIKLCEPYKTDTNAIQSISSLTKTGFWMLNIARILPILIYHFKSAWKCINSRWNIIHRRRWRVSLNFEQFRESISSRILMKLRLSHLSNAWKSTGFQHSTFGAKLSKINFTSGVTTAPQYYTEE